MRLVAVGVVVVAVLAAVAACAPPPTPVVGIRVMTWNVETHAHEPAEWVDVIARERPDVLGLQEICSSEAVALAAMLRARGLSYTALPAPIRPPTTRDAIAPVNAALGPACATGAHDVEYGLAVLTRLPAGPPTIEEFPSDRRDEQRGYVSVPVTAPSGLRLSIVTSHIGLHGVQPGQLRLLADAVPAGPAVVMGDFNVASGDAALEPLRRAFTEVDPSAQYVTTAEGKIDYVYLRGLRAGDVASPGVTGSDHQPLIATVSPQ